MNKDEKINILREYLPIHDKVEYLRNKLYGISGVCFDEVKGHTDKTIIDNLMEIEKYEERLEYILSSINALTDEREKAIIKLVHVEGKRLVDVYKDDVLHYSYSMLKKMYYSGIKNIEFN